MVGSIGIGCDGLCRMMLGEKRAEVPSPRIRLKRWEWEGRTRRGSGRVSRRGIGTVCDGREVGGEVSKEARGGLVGIGSGVGVGEFRIGPARSTLFFSRFRDSFRTSLCTVVKVMLSDMDVVLLESLLLLEGGCSNELGSVWFVMMIVGVVGLWSRGAEDESKERRGSGYESGFAPAPAGKPSIMHRCAAGVVLAWPLVAA